MEKSKRRKVIFKIINYVLMVAVFAGMFCISISAGIAALVFSLIGFVFGYFEKGLRIQQKLYDKLIEKTDDLLAGKTIVINAKDDGIDVHVADTVKKKTKK